MHRDRKEMSGCLTLGRRRGGREWGASANGYGAYFESDENILKLTVMVA